MEERESNGRLPVMLWAAASLGAVLLIVALLGYSLVTAVAHSSPDDRVQSEAFVKPSPTPTRVPFVWTGEPLRITVPFYIFVLCDGETIEGAIYNGNIDGDYVALLATPDRDLIVAVLQGQQTFLPKASRIFKSPCAGRQFPGAVQ